MQTIYKKSIITTEVYCLIETKIVIKSQYRFNDSDKELITKFINSHFKESKKMNYFYIEERHGV